MTRFKALFQAATLVLALAWSPVASATGKALTLSLHPVYLLVGMAEFTYESRIDNYASGMNQSWYVALGAQDQWLSPIQRTWVWDELYMFGPHTKTTVGYRVYPVGSFYSGVTLSGDLTMFVSHKHWPEDPSSFMARSFVGGKRTTRFGMVLDGGIGMGIIVAADGDDFMPSPCLKANIGIPF